ncbi:MAG TPA: hypothetical protein V6D12_00275 [Candidatus Obscuribacterales bacterium]
MDISRSELIERIRCGLFILTPIVQTSPLCENKILQKRLVNYIYAMYISGMV